MRGWDAGDFDYDSHGDGYTYVRRPDERIASQIATALGSARTVLNVGAGTGSYEPTDRFVVAVEPSSAMRAQRPPHLAPAIDAVAESLPFDDDAFDAVMATLTVHHWRDSSAGLGELRRVARGPVVILTFDPDALVHFWLNDYSPEIIAVERRRFPPVESILDVLGGHNTVHPIPIALDCTDGFGEAFYGRPEAFLDPAVRRAQSGWAFVAPAVEKRAVDHLRRDLESGQWDRRYGQLRTQHTYDGAVRLITAVPSNDDVASSGSGRRAGGRDRRVDERSQRRK